MAWPFWISLDFHIFLCLKIYWGLTRPFEETDAAALCIEESAVRVVRFAFYVRGVVMGCAVLWESVRCEYVRGVVVRALCSVLWECFAVRVVRIICQRNCCTIGPNWERASYSRLSQQWIYSSNWLSALSFFVGLIIYQRFLKSIGTAWHWSEWK